MSTRVIIQPRSNTTTFYADSDSNLPVLGQSSYIQQRQYWMADLPYYQKVLDTDTVTIMMHTQYETSGPPISKLYICDSHKNVISAVNLNTAPYYKGYIYKPGNAYSSPFAGTVPLVSQCWSFNFNTFAPSLNGGGIYYLKFVSALNAAGEPLLTYYSEPLFVCNVHPNTLLFEYSYDSNNRAKDIIIEGFYSGASNPYSPSFSIRMEGYTQRGFNPKVINVGYTQQDYVQLQIKTQQVRTWTLNIGELQVGVPDYLIEKAAEALLADNLFINGYGYILFNPGSQDSLSDLFKIKSVTDGSPLSKASVVIGEINGRQQQALVTPNPVFPSRIFSSEFDPTFS